MNIKKLTAEMRVERAHNKLMQHKNFCAFSGVFMVGKVEVSDDVPTAMTNGRDVYYGRKFVDFLPEKQLNFVVVHEAMHKSFRHLVVWKDIAEENPILANGAMDYVINLLIVDMDPRAEVVEMPRDANGTLLGLYDTKYRDMDAKQVYNLLKKECKGQKDGGSGCPSGNGNPKNDDNGGTRKNFDEHDWEGAKKLTATEIEELGKEIDHALREGAILAGKMKGDMPRGINELLHPKVDWKEAMREFVKMSMRGGGESSWHRPNRRMLGTGLILPSSISRKAKKLVIGPDTSGSTAEMFSQFMSEVKSICDDVFPETIDVLYWDTEVARHETYRGAEVESLMDLTIPTGGGGTTPECVPRYMHENHIEAQAVIMLTDGYFYGEDRSAWSTCSAPVLWCVVGNKDFVPPVGQVVYVE